MSYVVRVSDMALGAVIALFIVGEVGIVFFLVSIPIIAAIETLLK